MTADSAAPTTTVQCNGSACLNGTYYTSAPVSVTLSGNDGAGSGVQKIRYTTDGTDPTPVNGSDYSGAISINSTATVKFRAYDNLGNEEAVGSQDVLLDGTPPNLSLTLTENPSSGAQHVSGSTLFYRPGTGGGTFRVTATADDPHTGLTSVDFPSVTNVTGGSSQTSSPYVEDYTWSASTTDAASHDVVATNGAGATTNVPFTLTQDSAAPTGQSITLTGANAPYYGSASVSFTLGDGNDGSGSGLDTLEQNGDARVGLAHRRLLRQLHGGRRHLLQPRHIRVERELLPLQLHDHRQRREHVIACHRDREGRHAGTECVAHRADRADGCGQPVLRRCDEDAVLPACRFGQLPAQRHRLRQRNSGRLGELPRRLRPLRLERLDGRRGHDEPV